jgi:hypothetical protein
MDLIFQGCFESAELFFKFPFFGQKWLDEVANYRGLILRNLFLYSVCKKKKLRRQ